MPRHGYRSFFLLPTRCRQSPQPSEHLEDIRQNSKKHEIKKICEQQIKSLSEIEHQEKSIREKVVQKDLTNSIRYIFIIRYTNSIR